MLHYSLDSPDQLTDSQICSQADMRWVPGSVQHKCQTVEALH